MIAKTKSNVNKSFPDFLVLAERIYDYFVHYGEKECFFSDIKKYLSAFLPRKEAAEMLMAKLDQCQNNSVYFCN